MSPDSIVFRRNKETYDFLRDNQDMVVYLKNRKNTGFIILTVVHSESGTVRKPPGSTFC